MDWIMVILRIIHIFSAVIWVGTTYSMVMFIGPTAQAVGTDAAKFMQHFTQKSGLTKRMSIVGGLTVLSGLLMYGKLFRGLANLNTGNGLALTFGGLFGILALVVGTRMAGVIKAMRSLGAEMAGKVPTPEQGARLGALQAQLGKLGAVNAILMSLALLGMTLSEYFAF
jgi:hypothetical protein